MSCGPPVDLLQALAFLGEHHGAHQGRVADALGLGPLPERWAYTDLFVFQLHPYASVHLGAEGQLGGAVRDRIAGFWRALGRTPPAEPDHLAALLGLYAGLLAAEGRERGAQGALVANGRRALLHEHIAPWMPFFLDRVQDLGGRFYGAWAGLLGKVLREELVAAPPAAPLPVHLREAPGLPDPRTHGAGAFVSGLLAPVRSGLVLTRADLVELGRSLGLGVRVGPRRAALDHLLGEAPEAVLASLGTVAAQRAQRHEAWAPALGRVAAHWAGRARAAASLLVELASEAGATRPAGAPS